MANHVPSPGLTRRGNAVFLLLALLCGAAAALFPPVLLLLPGLIVYAMYRVRPGALALLGGGFLAVCFLFYSTLTACCMGALVIGVAAAVYLGARCRLGNAYTVLTAGSVSVACLYAMVCLPGILSGEGAFAAAQQTVDTVLAMSRQGVEAMAPVGLSAESLEAVDAYYKLVSDSVATYVVAVLCACAGILALSNLLFFRLFARKQAKEFDLPPLRPFRLWQIPKSMVLGLFALLLGSLILGWTGWDYAEGMSVAVNTLITLPLMVQGVCVVDFIIHRSGRNVTAKRVLAYIAMGLLLSVMQMPLMTVGCCEQVFHLRARSMGKPPVQPTNPK